jgi:hypothetical protein
MQFWLKWLTIGKTEYCTVKSRWSYLPDNSSFCYGHCGYVMIVIVFEIDFTLYRLKDNTSGLQNSYDVFQTSLLYNWFIIAALLVLAISIHLYKPHEVDEKMTSYFYIRLWSVTAAIILNNLTELFPC